MIPIHVDIEFVGTICFSVKGFEERFMNLGKCVVGATLDYSSQSFIPKPLTQRATVDVSVQEIQINCRSYDWRLIWLAISRCLGIWHDHTSFPKRNLIVRQKYLDRPSGPRCARNQSALRECKSLRLSSHHESSRSAHRFFRGSVLVAAQLDFGKKNLTISFTWFGTA